MSAQQLMLEAAQRRRDELEGEITAREADIEKSKAEEEGWRKEAQAALDAAAENWAKSGDVRERHLEKGRGERAYQAKTPAPRRFGPVVSEPMPHNERGRKGAAARWAGVSPEERSRQARDAANKGWAKRKAEKTV